jgi:hypothetical protein
MSLLFGAWHASRGGPPQKIHISDYDREMKGNIICAACSGGLIAKRGALKVHHYAHQVACTAYVSSNEPMTSWHASWQDICLRQHVEVPVDATVAGRAVRCIADIRCANGTVIEVQHSAISSTEMLKREAVHADIIWIVDARTPRSCKSEECRDEACDGRHIPVVERVAGYLTNRPPAPATSEFAIFTIEVRGLSFPFASNRTVVFDTAQGLFSLRRRLGRRAFLGAKVDSRRFFETYFSAINASSTDELVARYAATCVVSDPTGVEKTQFKRWGFVWQPGKCSWRPVSTPVERAPEPPPEEECFRAALSPSEPSRNLDDAERGPRLHTEPKSPITFTKEDNPSSVNPLPAGGSEDTYWSWAATEAKKGTTWTSIFFGHHESAPPCPISAPWESETMKKISKEVWLAQAINQTAPRTAQPQVDRAEWWKGARPEDIESAKRKRTGNKGALPSKRSAIATIQDKVAFLNQEKPYIQRARDLRRAKK